MSLKSKVEEFPITIAPLEIQTSIKMERKVLIKKKLTNALNRHRGNEKLVIMALYRSPLTVMLWPSSFLKKYGPMIPPAHKVHQTVSLSGCNGVSTYT
ncbi:hypothetical protein TNCV_4221051 [Trichonephila clavipes]|nr:hypothetical protein TNCV_4221051 [Trichonephila clavipes]